MRSSLAQALFSLWRSRPVVACALLFHFANIIVPSGGHCCMPSDEVITCRYSKRCSILHKLARLKADDEVGHVKSGDLTRIRGQNGPDDDYLVDWVLFWVCYQITKFGFLYLLKI